MIRYVIILLAIVSSSKTAYCSRDTTAIYINDMHIVDLNLIDYKTLVEIAKSEEKMHDPIPINISNKIAGGRYSNSAVYIKFIAFGTKYSYGEFNFTHNDTTIVCIITFNKSGTPLSNLAFKQRVKKTAYFIYLADYYYENEKIIVKQLNTNANARHPSFVKAIGIDIWRINASGKLFK